LISLHCTNILPPSSKNDSALWGVLELPGICLHRHLSPGTPRGWRVEAWADNQATVLSQQVVLALAGQVFDSRRDTLQAVALIMEIS